MTKKSKVIDEMLGNLAEDLINYDQRMTKSGAPPIRFVHKYTKEAKQSLATELGRMLEEALPEKRQTEADKLRAKGHRIVGSSPFIDAENNAYNLAIDQTRTRLTAIIERELG